MTKFNGDTERARWNVTGDIDLVRIRIQTTSEILLQL